MKLGLIARSEQRGLGNLSFDFHRNLHPDKTLVVIPSGVARHGLKSDLSWYPGAAVAKFDGHLNEAVCREWLDGLDVVLGLETFYDWRFCSWARDAHVATVVLAMPEWWRPQWADEPTEVWAPTSWRLDLLPPTARVSPVPIIPRPQAERADGPFRWLHVAGAQTHADRNGTNAVLEAARHLTVEQRVVVRSQSPGLRALSLNVAINEQSLPDRWDLYSNADALVMPRRYAGLCLPVLEAFACGLPVVMTDISPQNSDWPVQTVTTTPGTPLNVFARKVATGDADPRALAGQMDRWASRPALVDGWREMVARYTEANAWPVRAPQILGELERVADLVTA